MRRACGFLTGSLTTLRAAAWRRERRMPHIRFMQKSIMNWGMSCKLGSTLTTIFVLAAVGPKISMLAAKFRIVMRPLPMPSGIGGISNVDSISSRARKELCFVSTRLESDLAIGRCWSLRCSFPLLFPLASSPSSAAPSFNPLLTPSSSVSHNPTATKSTPPSSLMQSHPTALYTASLVNPNMGTPTRNHATKSNLSNWANFWDLERKGAQCE
mmetsp:Transcript_601/g.1258  ORF Transcript_601/g.1258 Transcript_601/m.1258 type:complete len:213 (+) Transcript_601:1698-2336(+)